MISDAKLTNPDKAETFMRESGLVHLNTLDLDLKRLCRTGAAILSPSIGNLHGSYLNPPNFRQQMSVVIKPSLS